MSSPLLRSVNVYYETGGEFGLLPNQVTKLVQGASAIFEAQVGMSVSVNRKVPVRFPARYPHVVDLTDPTLVPVPQHAVEWGHSILLTQRRLRKSGQTIGGLCVYGDLSKYDHLYVPVTTALFAQIEPQTADGVTCSIENIAHEIAHSLWMDHCPDEECIMTGSDSFIYGLAGEVMLRGFCDDCTYTLNHNVVSETELASVLPATA